MQVIVIIYEFPPVGGGGGHVAEDICRGLVQRGHEVLVITSHWGNLPRQENRHGIEILRVPALRKYPYKARFVDMLGYILGGFFPSLRQVRQRKPDVIHVHFAVPSGALAWMISRLTGVPYILTAHLGDVPGGVPEKTERWFRWIYPFTHPIWKSASAVFGVSEFTRRLAREHYGLAIDVIPNGVDLDLLKPGAVQTGSPPRIIFAGRFVRQKNPLQIVQTLANLEDLPWECVMLGDGPLRSIIEESIANHGLKERFTLTGWVSPDEVVQWFAKSDILFMPSISEGLPVVGVQALAMGLAIVATPVGGFVDLVDSGKNGFLVDCSNGSGESALRELLTSTQKLENYRRASRQHAHVFCIDKIVNSYEKALLTVGNVSEPKGGKES